MQYASDAFLTKRVPEAKCLHAHDRKNALADAECMVGLCAFGCRAQLAHAMYAAHLLASRFPDTLGGEQGPVTSMKAGEIQATFAVTAAEAGDSLALTSYGRRFKELCAATPAPYVVG